MVPMVLVTVSATTVQQVLIQSALRAELVLSYPFPSIRMRTPIIPQVSTLCMAHQQIRPPTHRMYLLIRMMFLGEIMPAASRY